MKKLLFVSNLFPRPDMPRCGVYNGCFVESLGQIAKGGVESGEWTVGSGEWRKIEHRTFNIQHRTSNEKGGGRKSACHAVVTKGEGWIEHRIKVDVLVPVAEWRVWKYGGIREWKLPDEVVLPESVRVRYVPVFYIPVVGRFLSGFFCEMALLRCRSLFDGCDVVLGSWLYPDCVAAEKVATVCGKPFWARLHGTDRFHLDARFRGRVCGKTLDTAKGVFVNAEFMRQELIDRNIADDKICVVRNGVDQGLFRLRERADAVAELDSLSGDLGLPLAEDERVILWVGNLVGIKGPDVALRAFAGRSEKGARGGEGQGDVESGRLGVGSGSRLVFVGEGRMRDSLEVLARELGISECVSFLGSLGRDKVALWMNVADCLLLTSFSEGMPNVVIEALASGTPVVATDVGDVATVVQEGVNGRVVAVGSAETVEDLAEALQGVLVQEWNAVEIRKSVAVFDWGRSAEAVVGRLGRFNREFGEFS